MPLIYTILELQLYVLWLNFTLGTIPSAFLFCSVYGNILINNLFEIKENPKLLLRLILKYAQPQHIHKSDISFLWSFREEEPDEAVHGHITSLV